MPRTFCHRSPGQPYPRHAGRKRLAAIISQEFFPISPRSLERWPPLVRRINGRALCVVKDALSMAEAKTEAARVYKASGVSQKAANGCAPRRPKSQPNQIKRKIDR